MDTTSLLTDESSHCAVIENGSVGLLVYDLLSSILYEEYHLATPTKNLFLIIIFKGDDDRHRQMLDDL